MSSDMLPCMQSRNYVLWGGEMGTIGWVDVFVVCAEKTQNFDLQPDVRNFKSIIKYNFN